MLSLIPAAVDMITMTIQSVPAVMRTIMAITNVAVAAMKNLLPRNRDRRRCRKRQCSALAVCCLRRA